MPNRVYNVRDWTEIADDGWTGLLVGNGASMAVWPSFSYGSLFDEACPTRAEHRLTGDDVALFDSLKNTRNFEQVLDALTTARLVNQALGYVADYIEERYASIQRALFSAIRAVHVARSSVSEAVLRQIRHALVQYRNVFTTNYDLLLYWAITTDLDDPHRIVDLFWGGTFDAANVGCRDDDTRIMYVHGGLHLYRQAATGYTGKNIAANGPLLDQFGSLLTRGDTPLLISEGTSEDKLRTIRASDYLSYCYQQFGGHEGPLVIFGHSLGSGDRHLTDAMRKQPWERRRIAISVHLDGSTDVREMTANFVRKLPGADLVFFDAATHPLGDPTLDMSRPPLVRTAGR